MRIVHSGGATVVNHDGVDYAADESGVFDVPTHVGQALTRFPDWDEEYVALDRAENQRVAAQREPDVQAAAIAALEQRVTLLETQVAVLEDAATSTSSEPAPSKDDKPKA